MSPGSARDAGGDPARRAAAQPLPPGAEAPAATGRVLVTGAQGFVGRWLLPALRADGWEVVPTCRSPEPGMEVIDVIDAAAVRATIDAVQPDAVVHLAGVTYLPDVEADPAGSFQANVIGTLNLLEAVARRGPEARLLLVSSCSVYGTPDPKDLPLTESAPLRAVHPYGVQKIGLELIAERFRREAGLDLCIARPFNHIGPGQDRRISLTHFAHQIAAIERGEREPVLRTGNLEARRDFLDVRDVVSAYRALLAHPSPPPLVNVASGHSVGIGEALEAMLRLARIEVRIETDPSRLRRVDVPDLSGDATLLRRATGWVPRHELGETLRDILEAARSAAGGTAT